MRRPEPRRPAGRRRAGTILRQAVEAALADGQAVGDLVLRLTPSDMAEIKRDPEIAVEDISFLGGEMRYLGVRVIAGGVPTSVLERQAAEGAA